MLCRKNKIDFFQNFVFFFSKIDCFQAKSNESEHTKTTLAVSAWKLYENWYLCVAKASRKMCKLTFLVVMLCG
jgi:hypothetical protein